MRGKGAEEQGIDEAEHGAVGANAQGQNDYGHGREARVLGQQPQAVLDVLPECAHCSTPLCVLRCASCVLRFAF